MLGRLDATGSFTAPVAGIPPRPDRIPPRPDRILPHSRPAGGARSRRSRSSACSGCRTSCPVSGCCRSRNSRPLARSAPVIAELAALAAWLGRDGRLVTDTDDLADDDAADACRQLRIGPERLSSLWQYALISGWFELEDSADLRHLGGDRADRVPLGGRRRQRRAARVGGRVRRRGGQGTRHHGRSGPVQGPQASLRGAGRGRRRDAVRGSAERDDHPGHRGRGAGPRDRRLPVSLQEARMGRLGTGARPSGAPPARRTCGCRCRHHAAARHRHRRTDSACRLGAAQAVHARQDQRARPSPAFAADVRRGPGRAVRCRQRRGVRCRLRRVDARPRPGPGGAGTAYLRRVSRSARTADRGRHRPADRGSRVPRVEGRHETPRAARVRASLLVHDGRRPARSPPCRSSPSPTRTTWPGWPPTCWRWHAVRRSGPGRDRHGVRRGGTRRPACSGSWARWPQTSHPDAVRVLDVLGTYHPNRRVAREARKAVRALARDRVPARTAGEA